MLVFQQLTCSVIKNASKANAISPLLRLFQARSKQGCSRLSSFLPSESSPSFIPSHRLLSALWLSITADYSLQPDFHPPACACVFVCVRQSALLIMCLYLCPFLHFVHVCKPTLLVCVLFFHYLIIYRPIFVRTWVSLWVSECVSAPLLHLCVFVYLYVVHLRPTSQHLNNIQREGPSAPALVRLAAWLAGVGAAGGFWVGYSQGQSEGSGGVLMVGDLQETN